MFSGWCGLACKDDGATVKKLVVEKRGKGWDSSILTALNIDLLPNILMLCGVDTETPPLGLTTIVE